MKIEDLKPAPYNPRKIDEASLRGLGKSIEKFGDISGIVWNKKSGHLVCGHQRLEALKKQYPDLKIEDNVILAGDKKFLIRIVEWDSKTEKLANIAANNSYISGTFDFVKLDEIIQELKPIAMEDLMILRIEDLIPPIFGIDNSDNLNQSTTEFILKVAIPIRTWTVQGEEIQVELGKVLQQYGGTIKE
jgi:hypothetical protein